MSTRTTDSLTEMRFLKLNKILELIPVSKSTWWNNVNIGLYPAPVKISKRVTAWRVDDIRQLLDQLGDKK